MLKKKKRREVTKNEEYTLGDVAAETGLTSATLVSYEREGAIPEARRSTAGWRVYSGNEFKKVVKAAIKEAGRRLEKAKTSRLKIVS